MFYISVQAWSQSCCPFHVLKALALPNPSETSNAESPTPMHILTSGLQGTAHKANWCIQTSPGAFPVALFSTDFRTCEILRTSKPKRTVTPFYNLCAQPTICPLGLSAWVKRRKVNIFLAKVQRINKEKYKKAGGSAANLFTWSGKQSKSYV